MTHSPQTGTPDWVYVAAGKGKLVLTGTACLCADEASRQLTAHLSQEVVSENVVMIPDLQTVICIFSAGPVHLEWIGKHQLPCTAQTPCSCQSVRLTVRTAVAG